MDDVEPAREGASKERASADEPNTEGAAGKLESRHADDFPVALGPRLPDLAQPKPKPKPKKRRGPETPA